MPKKDSNHKKQNTNLERLFTIGLYLHILISLGTLVFGSFWLFLKTTFIGFVILAIIGLFIPKEAMDRIIYGTMPHNNTPSNEREEASENPDWDNDYKPIKYDDEDTYDNFYMQREDEYREEYGDDFEDAIDDAREERRRNS